MRESSSWTPAEWTYIVGSALRHTTVYLRIKRCLSNTHTLDCGQSVVPEVESSEVELGPRTKPRDSLQLVEPQMKVGYTINELEQEGGVETLNNHTNCR